MDDKKKGIPFRDFLDKTTNLITLFGVFNALFIYSSTIETNIATDFLLPSFFLLSMLVWLELILFTLSSSDGSFRYKLFYFLFCSVEIGLTYYFIIEFSDLLIQTGIIGILLLAVTFLAYILLRFCIKRLERSHKKQREIYIYIALICSVVLSGFLIKWILYLVNS